jgi:murein DD-endopeptidase MepM/ murein hydrolase activator NlpD
VRAGLLRPRTRGAIVICLAALCGPAAAWAGDGGAGSAPPAPPSTPRGDERPADPPPATHTSALDAQVSNRRNFFYGRQLQQLTYTLKGDQRQDVRVDLVRLSTGKVVASWATRGAAPGESHTIRWRGLVGGRAAPAGRYDFRLALGARARARATGGAKPSGGDVSAGHFAFLSDFFPVRGRHDYGGAGNRYGARRAGHTHQGQDVMSRCGTRLVAVRGGRVRTRGSQRAAGNYVVIDGANTSYDTVYMHLRSRALVKKGQRVYTGQLLGYVGRTGDATACHLHFEIWSGGWYQRGGRPIDPLGYLRAWDRVS